MHRISSWVIKNMGTHLPMRCNIRPRDAKLACSYTAYILNVGLRPSMLQCEIGRSRALAHRSTPIVPFPLPIPTQRRWPTATSERPYQRRWRGGDVVPQSLAPRPRFQLPLHSPELPHPTRLRCSQQLVARVAGERWAARSVFLARPARFFALPLL